MDHNIVKIRFKYSDIEIECEGNESFIVNDISNVVAKIISQFKEVDFTPPHNPVLAQVVGEKPIENKLEFDYSVNAIAARMNVKTGPELIIAASAQLTFSENKNLFTSKEIHATMKLATGHYNKSMGSNLATYINNLVKKGKLNQNTKGEYALSAGEKKVLEKLIAQDE